MERKIQIAAPDNTCLGTKRAQMLYCIQAVPAGRSRRLSAARCVRFQKNFLDRGNSPFGETNNARRRTARSALSKKLPAPCCLSARRFGTQLSSFLFFPYWGLLSPVYGQARPFQGIWHESTVSVTKSRFLLRQNRATVL